jgi:rSAM/selenodomain-associated transferase 2
LRPLLRAWWRELFGVNERLSVVLPTLNAAETLPSCLAQLGDAYEVIVVDGGSSDDTRGIAREHGAIVLQSPRGRGTQLCTGANAASGDWLLFLHADTFLGVGWNEAVDRHWSSFRQPAGFFRFKLRSQAWQARVVEAGVAFRVSILGLPYGDQGLLISRDLYRQVGGYKPLPLLEDVDLVRRLGRRRLRPLAADAITSAERWQRDGWFARSARNLSCLGLYLAGVSPARVAQIYHRPVRSGQGVEV